MVSLQLPFQQPGEPEDCQPQAPRGPPSTPRPCSPRARRPGPAAGAGRRRGTVSASQGGRGPNCHGKRPEVEPGSGRALLATGCSRPGACPDEDPRLIRQPGSASSRGRLHGPESTLNQGTNLGPGGSASPWG